MTASGYYRYEERMNVSLSIVTSGIEVNHSLTPRFPFSHQTLLMAQSVDAEFGQVSPRADLIRPSSWCECSVCDSGAGEEAGPLMDPHF